MSSDLRFSIRLLAKSPVFTLIAVITLAIGIGSATVVFSAINAFFLRPLPLIREIDRMLYVAQTDLEHGHGDLGLNYADFLVLKERLTTVEGIWVQSDRTVILNGTNEPERLHGTEISTEAFDLLGVQPILGRNFRPGEDDPQAKRVALISYGLWHRNFGGAAEILGASLSLNGEPTTIIGVMPKGWGYPEVSEIWTPLMSGGEKAQAHGHYYLRCRAKIKPGVTIEQVRTEAEAIMASLAIEYKQTNDGIGISLQPLREQAVQDSAQSIKLLFGAVLFVFIISCLNVANLLLARGYSRSKEIAVRLALGAERRRLIKQLITECLVLGVAGGIGGFIFALWGLDLMVAAIPVELPFWLRFEFDGRVFGFVAGLSILSAAIFGLIPAIKSTRPCLVNQLKEGGRGNEDPGASTTRLRNSLVIVEVAIALVLLVGATLLLRSFLNLRRVSPGLEAAHVLTFRTGFPSAMVGTNENLPVQFIHDVETRLAAVPGVISVGAGSNYWATLEESLYGYVLDGGAVPTRINELRLANLQQVSPGFFSTLQIPLLAGRQLTSADTATAPQVALVDRTFAETHFGSVTGALGHRLRLMEKPGEAKPPVEIVGVVGTVIFKPDVKRLYPTVYRPHAQEKSNFMSVVIRTEGDPATYVTTARNEVLMVNKQIPIYYVFTLEDVLLRAVWTHRFFSYLFGASGAIALFLACIGIYGVMTYNVSQRQQELGMRMALGAQPTEVVKMILRHGLTLVGSGLGCGLVVAFFAVPLLASTLYGISPRDPPTFALVPVLLTVVALVACYVPTRRIIRIDPNAAMRYE